MKIKNGRPPKRHHIVSMFYLSFFKSPGQRGKNPVVWVYDKECPEPRLVSVRNAAVENDLNTLQIGGLPNTELESLLGSLESRVKPIFERWHQGGVNEKPPVNELVAEFLALQYLRVPRSINLVEEAMVMSANRWIDSLRDNPDKLTSVLAQMIEDGYAPQGGILDRVCEDLQNERHRPSLSLKRSVAVSFSILQCEDVARSLVSMDWRLVRAGSNEAFITSDCPVCPCAIEGRTAKFGSLWDHPMVEVTFPLAPEVCLVLCRRGSFLKALPDSAAVTEVNRRTALMAERFVFASEKSEAVQQVVSDFSYTRRGSKIGNVPLEQ